MWNLARVIKETTLSKSTLYRLIKDGKLNQPTRISTRRVAWFPEQIRAFLAGGAK